MAVQSAVQLAPSHIDLLTAVVRNELTPGHRDQLFAAWDAGLLVVNGWSVALTQEGLAMLDTFWDG